LAYLPEGTYRQEIRSPFRQDYTLVRTLHLNRDGSADLYTEYRGDRPSVDRQTREDYGDLMTEVRDHRRIHHRGTWRGDLRRVTVELTRLTAGGAVSTVHSAIEFDLSGDTLSARRQDTREYGSRLMRLRLENAFGDWDEPGYGRTRGTYGWSATLRSNGNVTRLTRRLRLYDNRSAELVSEYSGDRPRITRELQSEYGALLAEVASSRRITHSGRWSSDGRRIRVELERIGGGLFGQTVRSSFLLEDRGDELIVLEQDRGDYGSRIMRFRRDEFTSGDPWPGGGTPVTTEVDETTTGRGTVSREGYRPQEVDWARVILRRDGRFEIRLRGREELAFRGTYDVGRLFISLYANEAWGQSAGLAGRVSIRDNGEIGVIELRGEVRGDRVTVTFEGR
jgi:hypothetical protein